MNEGNISAVGAAWNRIKGSFRADRLADREKGKIKREFSPGQGIDTGQKFGPGEGIAVTPAEDVIKRNDKKEAA